MTPATVKPPGPESTIIRASPPAALKGKNESDLIVGQIRARVLVPLASQRYSNNHPNDSTASTQLPGCRMDLTRKLVLGLFVGFATIAIADDSASKGATLALTGATI